MSNSLHVQNCSGAAAGPSVAKLIRKFESMSTITAARPFRRGPSVSKLVEKYELLSCAAVVRPLRSKPTTGGGGEEEERKGGPVASPLKPQDLHCKDEQNAVPVQHVFSGTRPQLKSSLHCVSGDGDRRLLHPRNYGVKNFFLARYYDRCGIEIASLETRSVYRHHFWDKTAPGTTTTTSDVRDTTTMIAVTDVAVSSSYTGSEKLYKTATVVADDVGNDGTAKTTTMVSRRLKDQIKLDD